MQNPLVSFIVPCYKLDRYLAQCISSITTQSYENLEIIIMDDCSPDNTAAVAADLTDSRIKYVRNENNLGHLANYNKGIDMAKGEFIWLISADDFLISTEIVSKYVNKMLQHPDAAYVFSPVTAVDAAGTIGNPIDWTAPFSESHVLKMPEFLDTLIEGNCVAAPAGMVRRQCYEKMGAFPSDLPHAGDWYLWCKFAFLGDVIFLSEHMVAYRIHQSAMSAQMPRPAVRKDQAKVRWRVRSLCQNAGYKRLERFCEAYLSNQFTNDIIYDGLLADRSQAHRVLDDAVAEKGDKNCRRRIVAHSLEGLGDACWSRSIYDQSAAYYWESMGYKRFNWSAIAKLALLKSGRLGKAARRRLGRSS